MIHILSDQNHETNFVFDLFVKVNINNLLYSCIPQNLVGWAAGNVSALYTFCCFFLDKNCWSFEKYSLLLKLVVVVVVCSTTQKS